MLLDKDIKRFLISLFVLLNIFTVIYVNRPIPIKETQGSKLKEILHPSSLDHMRSATRIFFTGYGELVGLSTRWLMFVLQDRYNWSYLIKAKYEDSSEVILPIPRQGKRTILEREFFDFKDTKFQYNFNYRPYAKEHYASYLCRKYPIHNGAKVKSIIFELYKQNILELKEAEKRNRYLEPIIKKEMPVVFNCYSSEEVK